MSDEVETTNGKQGRDDRDRALIDPVPKDAAFFEWLEKLFYDDPEVAHFPEVIDCRPVSGKHCEKLGPYIFKKTFAPIKASEEAVKKSVGVKKPSREKLISMSNEILFLMQKDCDESRRVQTYGVHVWHFSLGDEPYMRYLKHCKPHGRYGKMDGNGSDDDEVLTTEQRFGVQVLGHQEKMFGLYGGAFEGMLDRFDRLIERSYDRIEKQDAVIQRQAEMLERALSQEAERAEKVKWMEIKAKAADKALEFGFAVAPPMLNSLIGKPIIPNAETAESITLKNFFKTVEDGGSLTKSQADTAFGVWDENNKNLVKQGILSHSQSEILFQVGYGQRHTDELDKIMPGGPMGISKDQIAALLKIFPMEQLAPLMILFESRSKRTQS